MYIQGHEYQYDLQWIVEQLERIDKQITVNSAGISKNQQDITALQQSITTQFNNLNQRITELSTRVDDLYYFVHSDEIFNNKKLTDWANANLPEMLSTIVKHVFFGLTADGKLTACIPECWNFINFSTSMNPCDCAYGHLKLRW